MSGDGKRSIGKASSTAPILDPTHAGAMLIAEEMGQKQLLLCAVGANSPTTLGKSMRDDSICRHVAQIIEIADDARAGAVFVVMTLRDN